MDVSEIPTVQLDREDHVNCKYVVAKITDTNNNSKIIVRGGRPGEYHEMIAIKTKKAMDPCITLEFLRGGYIDMLPIEREICLSGSSAYFRGQEPNRELTISLLQEAYPDYKVYQIFPDLED